MPPSRLEDLARLYRKRLAARERDEMRWMATRYREVWEYLAPQLNSLLDRVAAEVAAGKDPMVALFEAQRLQALREQLEQRTRRLDRRVFEQIQENRQYAYLNGLSSTLEIVRLAEGIDPRSVRLNEGAGERLWAAFDLQSPLRQETFRGLSTGMARDIENTLQTALALGMNPRKIASTVQDALGSSLSRALTISRTEMMRAYRGAAIDTYRSMEGVIKGYVWVSDPTERTCAACWALNGQFFPLEEEFGTHPNCRCSSAPSTRPADADGYVRGGHFTPGPERFEALPEASKLKILGPGKYAAYRDGRITLRDLVRERQSTAWGTTRSVASLQEATLAAKVRSIRTGGAPPPSAAGIKAPEEWEDWTDVEAWARSKRPNIHWNLDGMDAGTARQTIPALEEMLARFEDGGYAVTALREVVIDRSKSIASGWMAYNRNGGVRIAFSPNYYTRPRMTERDYQQVVQRGFDTKFHPVPTIRSTVIHEYGHTLYRALKTADVDGKFTAFMEEYYGLPGRRRGKKHVLYNVSGYAKESENEALAEFFSLMDYLPRKDWTPQMVELDNLIEELLH